MRIPGKQLAFSPSFSSLSSPRRMHVILTTANPAGLGHSINHIRANCIAASIEWRGLRSSLAEQTGKPSLVQDGNPTSMEGKKKKQHSTALTQHSTAQQSDA